MNFAQILVIGLSRHLRETILMRFWQTL